MSTRVKILEIENAATPWHTWQQSKFQWTQVANVNERCRPEINAKVYTFRGNILQLRTDVLVASRSPKNKAQTEFYEQLVRAAGESEIEEELTRIGRPRSGEAKITHGYHLPARYVAHVLRPRFPAKYEHAARSSLKRAVSSALEAAVDVSAKSITFSQFWLSREGTTYPFPPDLAWELLAKTLREFLERHPNLLERIVVHEDGDHLDLLVQALTRHFPRNAEEAQLLSQCDEEEDLPWPDEPIDPVTSVSGYVVPEYLNDDGTIRKNDTKTASSASQGGGPGPAAEDTQISRWTGAHLGDIEELHAITVGGEDAEGRPIVCWVQRRIVVRDVDLERVFGFLLKTVHEATRTSRCGGEFFVAYIQEGCRPRNVPPLPWLWETIHALAEKFGASAKRIFIVGDFLVRAVGFGMTRDLPIREKLRFINSAEDLLVQFPGGRIRRDVIEARRQ